jgi:hypothetical protein
MIDNKKEQKMIQNIFLTLFLSFLVSGCYDVETTDNNTNGVNNMQGQTQQNNASYQRVIDRLEGRASTPEEYFELANAYMQRSGLTFEKMINKINNSTKNTYSPFMAFVGSVKPKSQQDASSISDLNKAVDYEMKIIGDRCGKDTNLTQFEKDACLYKGLAQTMEVANTLNAMSDDVAKVEEQKDEKLQASSCAMEYAFNGRTSDCSVTEVGQVSFKESHMTYDMIDVFYNGKEYSYLLHENPSKQTRELIVTDGYCSTDDFNTRIPKFTNAEYYPCPATQQEDEDQITAHEALIDSLNEGTDAILAVADDYKELAQTVQDFKIEVSSLSADGEKNATLFETTINMQDMIEYLNMKNSAPYAENQFN